MSIARKVLAAAALVAAAAAHAQVPPTVRLIVGYAAGGPVDQGARMVAPFLAKELGTNVIVENKPGANGTTAGDLVAKSTPDGATLWFAASPPVTISPNLQKLPFDVAKDIVPVAPLVSYYNVLVINKDLPFKSLKDLIDYAKANPGKVSYGSAGVGGSNHLSGELLAARTGTKMLHVPYKGNAPAMTDVIGGQLTMMFDIISTARSYIAGDKVRAIAVTSPTRNSSLPNVPTMTESGIPDYEVGGWFALFASSKTPPALVSRLSQATANALKDPELKAKLEAAGFEVWQGTPDAVAARATKERAMWSTVTKDIKVE
ncbi:Bug family tripartite tricarboxylate transporter substrate binding protein [Ramlibacter albus]|uniref:Tripartite tricarboxylate transporter substrate binding protein n=1 Tax=Ramlibacter albus TaxID=2079448 RepID=A0A923MA87_9BURK|nr:tripartite tricarboxylate transporter substrate binding protein [Ramlibacter albus]MBC5765761.1 tripartite tricarboxylate transporter substrate binding protein [Ramlibacter albus]